MAQTISRETYKINHPTVFPLQKLEDIATGKELVRLSDKAQVEKSRVNKGEQSAIIRTRIEEPLPEDPQYEVTEEEQANRLMLIFSIYLD